MHEKSLMRIDEIHTTADLMVKSGLFKDVKDVAKAAVKIMAGQELGIPPVAAMRGIDIVEGQISIRAHLMAAMIKSSGKYEYRVTASDDKACAIEFWQHGERLGEYVFTMEDAQRAGLANRNTWKQHPKIMLYNRAMSMGAKVYCPDIFLGAIYDEGEIEAKPEPKQVPQMYALPEYGLDGTVRDDVEDMTLPEAEDDLPEPYYPPAAEGLWPEESKEAAIQEELGQRSLGGSEASEKQVSFLLGLLAERGVLEGDKHDLIEQVLGPKFSKQTASEAIDKLNNLNALPAAWINPYVKLLRTRSGKSASDVKTYLSDMFDTDKPAGLAREGQKELINWLADAVPTEVNEEMDEVEAGWVSLVEDLHKKSGFPHEFIDSYLATRCIPPQEKVVDGSPADLARFQEADTVHLVKGIEKAYDLFVSTQEK